MDSSNTVKKQLAERLRYLKELGVDFVRISSSRAAIPGTSSTHGDPGPIPQGEGAGQPAVTESRRARGKESVSLLTELRTYIGDCARCRLSGGRRHVVFGVGNPQAALMFIGEAPGVDEDIQGIPFVGRAGQLLTKIINAIGMDREQVYIANIIKCRPPGNRSPLPDEIETCVPFLYRQVEIIRPAIIVALGTFAAQTLLSTKLPITSLRGRFMKFRGTPLMPTFHPAFLLRNQNRKSDVWEDMKIVRDELKRIESMSQ